MFHSVQIFSTLAPHIEPPSIASSICFQHLLLWYTRNVQLISLGIQNVSVVEKEHCWHVWLFHI